MSAYSEYAPVVDNWDTKLFGPKPTATEINEANSTGRIGSKDTFAVAMALRPRGATQAQIKAALGGSHRNKIASLVAHGVARRVPMEPVNGYTVYKIELIKHRSVPQHNEQHVAA